MDFTVSLTRLDYAHLLCLIVRGLDGIPDSAAIQAASQQMVEECLRRELRRYCKARRSQVAVQAMDDILREMGYEP